MKCNHHLMRHTKVTKCYIMSKIMARSSFITSLASKRGGCPRQGCTTKSLGIQLRKAVKKKPGNGVFVCVFFSVFVCVFAFVFVFVFEFVFVCVFVIVIPDKEEDVMTRYHWKHSCDKHDNSRNCWSAELLQF